MTVRLAVCLGLAAILALGIGAAGPARAQTMVVIPNVNEEDPGPSNNAFPFNNGDMRYQQVYAADQFQGLAGVVSEIAFRVDEEAGNPFDSAPIETEIRLSHTSAVPQGLSETFDDNIGADETLVWDGPLTLSSDGTFEFDIVLDVDDIFAYNGVDNLLVEIKVFGPSFTSQFDSAGTGLGEGGTDWTDRLWAFGPDAETGSLAGDDGYVTQFTILTDCVMDLAIGNPRGLTAGAIGLPTVAPRGVLTWQVGLHHVKTDSVEARFISWIEDADGRRAGLDRSQPQVIHFGDHIQHLGSLRIPPQLAPGTYRLVVRMNNMKQGVVEKVAQFRVGGS